MASSGTADQPLKVALEDNHDAPDAPPGARRIMLALAHKLHQAIATGQVCDQAQAARRIGITPARVSQLLDLLHLAPDLQERVLFLESVDGIELVTERDLRALTRMKSWEVQRVTFGSQATASGLLRSRL